MSSSRALAEASEKKILSALLKKSPLTWTQLLQATKLSSRTLHKALIRLENQGKVFRKIEVSDKYPPPVLYGLADRDAALPILFESYATNYILGLSPQWQQAEIREEEKEVKIKLEVKNDYAGLTLAERYQILALRLFATKLFCLLQALNSGNELWLTGIGEGLPLIPEFLIQLGLQEIKTEAKTEKITELDNSLIFKLKPTIFLTKEAVKQLRNMFQNALPKEYSELQKIYEKCLKEIKD